MRLRPVELTAFGVLNHAVAVNGTPIHRLDSVFPGNVADSCGENHVEFRNIIGAVAGIVVVPDGVVFADGRFKRI